MKPDSLPFVFSSKPYGTEQDFVILIPSGIDCKEGVFHEFAEKGDFPGYFGRNWDALLDCLRDFSWIKNRRIVIIHQDLPLKHHKNEVITYLDILKSAVIDMQEVRSGPFADMPSDWEFVEHELVVVFPDSEKFVIQEMLSV